ncbi:general odorant-binding protein 1-like [Helicoverpa zea]|uniref:general odorant-binding protein 1-like n=1 Tax=Helicoverpa zea TaxID=7113 RepID=UPI001F57DF36|nr:general odorant-binding protein 1-like [Helicoverpa zea]
MGSRHVFFVLVVLAVSVRKAEPSKDAMQYITSGFVKVLEECKHELNLNEQILADLFHFWKLEYSLLGRDTGCAIICMSKKLDLLDANGRMHHGNAAEFAKKHGAGDEVASKIVTIIHECEKKHEQDGDECLRVLEVAKCFRTGIHDLDWQPKVEVIVSEVLTEI